MPASTGKGRVEHGPIRCNVSMLTLASVTVKDQPVLDAQTGRSTAVIASRKMGAARPPSHTSSCSGTESKSWNESCARMALTSMPR